MNTLSQTKNYLGDPYKIHTIDGADSICRNLDNGYEFEVFKTDSFVINVWTSNPQNLVGIYTGITSKEHLKDTLGYLAFKYQNLWGQIQVEREE